MKTTVDLPENLVRSAKRAAIERRTTLRQLVQQGLQRELADPSPAQGVHPLRAVAELGQQDWSGTSADAYVESQREGW